MKRLSILLLVALLVAGCARGETPPSQAAAELARADWRRIEEQARGAEVVLFMAGTSDLVNRYLDEFVAPELYLRYGITLRRMPVSSLSAVVQDLLNERQSPQPRTGRADLLWINGADLKRAREGGALFGPWARELPNARLVEWVQHTIAYDAGVPVAGYAAPWGQSVFLAVYDTARVSDPPATMGELEAWARAHPGRFTYPRPPSPEGRAFVCQVFYELTGGYAQWQGELDLAEYAAKSGPVWDYLQRLRPYLWREGHEYPQSALQLERLFATGAVDFSFSYNPGQVWRRVASGALPRTTSLYPFEHGALASTHYLAIPFNAPHAAAAMVVANWLQSATAQADKAQPEVWGDLPVIEARLVQEATAAGTLVPAAGTSVELWRGPRLPEPPQALAERLEHDWVRLVLER